MDDYMSNPHNIRDLIDSVAWIDIKGEITSMLEDIHMNMETVKNTRELLRFQGRAQALRAVLFMPEIMLEAIEENIKDKEDNKEGLDDE